VEAESRAQRSSWRLTSPEPPGIKSGEISEREHPKGEQILFEKKISPQLLNDMFFLGTFQLIFSLDFPVSRHTLGNLSGYFELSLPRGQRPPSLVCSVKEMGKQKQNEA